MRQSATRRIRLEELDLEHAPEPKWIPDDKRAHYEQIKAALSQYWKGAKPKEIRRRYGLSRQALHHYEERFFSTDQDGRILGFRACVGHARVKPYTRMCEASTVSIFDGRSAAGCFQQCLREHPKAAKALKDAIAPNSKTKFSNALDFTAIHQAFPNALRADGVPPTHYPFCVRSLGYESVRKEILKAVRKKGRSRARLDLFGHNASDGLDGRSGENSWLRSLLPCDIACYDEQLLPAIGTVVIDYEGQRLVLPMERLSLCLLVSTRPKCILAYHLSNRKRVSGADFLETFSNLLTEWKPRVFSAVPTLAYKPGAGLPSGKIPGFLDSFRIGLLRVVNDMTHFADAVLVYLKRLLGLSISFGQIRRWITRVAVEQVFGELQSQLSKLPSTTGSGPHDRHVKDPVGGAVKWEITRQWPTR